jgi:uncharacterized repeat protein (TIGR01451 family)
MLKINDRIKKIFSVALSGALLSFNLVPFAVSPVYATGASLELTNTVDNNLADRGEVLNYTITVKNTGSVDTTNTFLWINQPNLADYIAGSGTYTRTSTNVTNNLPDSWISDGANFGKVPAGTNVLVKYQTRVAQNANNDNIVWSVGSVKSDQTSQVQANSWTRVLLKNPNLCGSKKADKTTATVGETITFTAEACNDGNVVLNDVLIYDRLDSRFDYIPGSTTLTLAGQTIAVDDGWLKLHVNVGNVNPGQNAVLTYKVKVNSTAKAGDTIQNVAQFNSRETDKWLQCAVLIKVEGKGGFLKIFKFEDLNSDGVFNTNEQGLPGFQFRIVGEGKDFTVTTSDGGVFLSEELPVGTYTISEIVPDNWQITTQNDVKVEVKAGMLSEVRFGDKQTGKVLPELPNTGPGVAFLLLLGTVPAGYAFRFLKRKI